MPKKLPFLFCLCLAALLAACGSEGVTTDSGSPGKKEVVTITNRSWFALDPANSTVEWNRNLDQKATKKKMKVFGNWVDIEIGPVQMETSGTVDMAEGIPPTEDEELKDGVLVFDMTAFNINDAEGGGIFKARDFPRSKFVITAFSPDSGQTYNVEGNLTLQDSTQNMSFPVVVEQTAGQLSMRGQLVLHTLDWPLRDAEARDIVNTDDITIDMNLSFQPDSSASDTVIVLE